MWEIKSDSFQKCQAIKLWSWFTAPPPPTPPPPPVPVKIKETQVQPVWRNWGQKQREPESKSLWEEATRKSPTCSPKCSLRPFPTCQTQQQKLSRSHLFHRDKGEKTGVWRQQCLSPAGRPQGQSKATGISAGPDGPGYRRDQAPWAASPLPGLQEPQLEGFRLPRTHWSPRWVQTPWRRESAVLYRDHSHFIHVHRSYMDPLSNGSVAFSGTHKSCYSKKAICQ